MPGVGSTISLDGGRSEALAEYLFAAWSGALRGRSDSDFGIDFFCTLSEAIGKQAWVRANYTVQVKSNHDPWIFSTADEVRWLVQHLAAPTDEQLSKAVINLREMLDCVGSQLFARGNSSTLGAVEASLLFRWLETRFGDLFNGQRLLEGPRSLSGLFRALADGGSLYGGIDALQRMLEEHALIQRLKKQD